MVLPEDLVLEVLTRLPGKPLGRCKCVCKPWLALIKSHRFRDVYRRRQRGMIVYWSQGFDPVSGTYSDYGRCFRMRFFHAPLRRLEEPVVEFSPLHDIEVGTDTNVHAVTQLINGLLCVGERPSSTEHQYSLYNVCTGEMMRLPDPKPDKKTLSTFHLGYDCSSRTYKVLRMTYACVESVVTVFPIRASVMTVRPSSEPSVWRELDYRAAGIADLPRAYAFDSGGILPTLEMITGPGDSSLCWFSFGDDSSPNNLLCFDLSEESFRLVGMPAGNFMPAADSRGLWAVTQCMGRLAVWSGGSDEHPARCYVIGDDEGKVWTEHCVELPRGNVKKARFAISYGNPSSDGEMLLMNPEAEDQEGGSRPVYSLGRCSNMMDSFLVGKIPHNRRLHLECLCHFWHGFARSRGRLVSLFEANNLYLPLDEILSGGL